MENPIPEFSVHQFLFLMGFVLPVILMVTATFLTMFQPNLSILPDIWGGVAGIGGVLAIVSLLGLGIANS